ncbi:MAG: hypothetical protein A2Z96_07620 [Spirochaetes bacterium GWB1_48_6]|nr:MAG: hypothetical protein A2Z96_07620 [Spirochaetes bacterium GWB1_48_6]
MRKKYLTFLFFILVFGNIYPAPSFLERAQELLLADKPQDAATFLEAALVQGPPTEKIYLYLGLAYTALGKNSQALKCFQSGAGMKGLDEVRFLYNTGLLYQKMENPLGAEESYSQVLGLEPLHQGALLNRGNSRLQDKKYSQAMADYKKLLTINPTHDQKDKINQILGLLATQVQAEEDQKALDAATQLAKAAQEKALAEAQAKLEEEARVQAEKLAEETAKSQAEALAKEQERLAEEQKLREELLAKIRASLGNVNDETKTLKAGDKGVETAEEDVPLAD